METSPYAGDANPTLRIALGKLPVWKRAKLSFTCVKTVLLYEVLVNKTNTIAPTILTTAISTNQKRLAVIPNT